MAHYKDTQLPAEVDPEILWDEHSALIGEDIDDLSYWSGKDVMKKEDFLKAIATYANKAYRVQQENKELKEALQNLCDVLPKGVVLHDYFAKIQLVEARHVLVMYNDIKTFLDGAK
jgi:hypothetical protein